MYCNCIWNILASFRYAKIFCIVFIISTWLSLCVLISCSTWGSSTENIVIIIIYNICAFIMVKLYFLNKKLREIINKDVISGWFISFHLGTRNLTFYTHSNFFQKPRVLTQLLKQQRFAFVFFHLFLFRSWEIKTHWKLFTGICSNRSI